MGDHRERTLVHLLLVQEDAYDVEIVDYRRG